MVRVVNSGTPIPIAKDMHDLSCDNPSSCDIQQFTHSGRECTLQYLERFQILACHKNTLEIIRVSWAIANLNSQIFQSFIYLGDGIVKKWLRSLDSQ